LSSKTSRGAVQRLHAGDEGVVGQPVKGRLARRQMGCAMAGHEQAARLDPGIDQKPPRRLVAQHRPHAMAEDREGTVEMAGEGGAQQIDRLGNPADRRLPQPLLAAGKLHGA